jgi:hypothetical protein
MNKRHILLLVCGLAMSLALVLLGSLALAQEPVLQGDSDVHIRPVARYVEGQELIGLTVGQVVSHAVRIEPLRLQVAERIIADAPMSPIKPLLSEVRLAECHHTIQPLRSEFEALTGQAVAKVCPIPYSVPTPGLFSHMTRAAAECLVTSTGDAGPGTLRWCLENAVAGNTIAFDVAVFPPASPVTICLSSGLPWITTDHLTVDASDAGVILDGSGLSSGDGFVIFGADGVKIQGLQIVHFPRLGVGIGGGARNTVIGGDRFTGSGPLGQGNLISGNGLLGVWFEGTGTMRNTVHGNYIGTDVFGTAALGNAFDGVAMGYGASDNTIGGITTGTFNLISSNGDDGVHLQDRDTTGNQILGNLIGTDVSGTTALGNLGNGVLVGFEASNNIIGGSASGAGNLISGNKGDAGVKIMGSGTTGNVVLGNYIGTDISGTVPLANIEHGVVVYDMASNNIVGGSTSGARNLISGNGEIGIVIAYVGASGNQVLGNYIGTDASGTMSIPNYRGVVIFEGPTGNTIGGSSLNARNRIIGNTEVGVRMEGSGTTDNTVAHNVVSGNGEDGIVIRNATGNQVLGNYIGTDPTGTFPLGNLRCGIVLDEASNNIIGGATSGAGNLISGNEFTGIHLQGAGTTDNQIQGNFVGTNVSGTEALGNLSNGIIVTSEASDNVIGGDRFTGNGPLGQGNLISGNEEEGIRLSGGDTTGNQIQGNFIGTDVFGTAALDDRGNLKGGIFIGGGASNNIVGGSTPGVRNLISGNLFDGVRLQDLGTTSNQVQGNFIGTTISGTAVLSNSQVGVAILGGASNNLIGGSMSGEGNLISGNELSGVYLQNPGTTGNRVQGNFVGTNFSGAASLGNLEYGIILVYGASNNFIGGDRFDGTGLLGQGNLVSGNGDCGIVLEDSGTTGNQIQGNFVGTNLSGTAVLRNLSHGVAVICGASDNIIGGNDRSVGNLVSGNEEGGVWLQDPGTTDNQVRGNLIGTDVSGTKPLGNRLGGVVLVRGASNNLIGGELVGQGNLISGNEYPGITLMGAGEGTSNNRVQGNLIGTDVFGTAKLGNFLNGVALIDGASDNIIGGATITAGNTIAFNTADGVYVSGEQTIGNTITHNSIHENGGLGIELTNGGNRELPSPTITTVAGTSVSGRTPVTPVIEVFSDVDGEGRWWEGSVIADANGVFTLTKSDAFHGPNLTATATDGEGNTTEFSAPFRIVDFRGEPRSGPAPLTVNFASTINGISAEEYLWTFGDGITGTQFLADHTYLAAGVYTVTLAVDGRDGCMMLTKPEYIHVSTSVFLPVVIQHR